MTQIASFTVPVRPDQQIDWIVRLDVIENGKKRRQKFVYHRSIVGGGKLWVETPGNQPITHIRYRRAR